ncbi:MAG: hypothetical protein AAF928_04770 [Myxococcota bacterium]
MHAIIRSTVFTVAGGVVACSSNASTPGAGGAGAAVDDDHAETASSGTGSGGGGTGGEAPDPRPDGPIDIVIPFPSGDRTYTVPPVQDSFGTHPPPPDAVLPLSNYAPRDGECSVATHDRYWVRARDGKVYPTWHPPSTIDVVTGQPCSFGHEHGDDPRTSPLYAWAGGVPFGMVNVVAVANGHHRHEDHFGHKVVVQNLYEVAVGNGPSEDAIQSAGFHCYWLSKVHQGTHSPDAFVHNMHEYQNSMICDDGAARQPDPGQEHNAGAGDHTESSVKTLTFWGNPSWFKRCDGLVPQHYPPLPMHGHEPPDDADTGREIKCAGASEGWTYKAFPTEVVGPTGEPNFAPVDAGADELWKPWMIMTDTSGETMYLSSAYYVVRDPVRMYNDGTLVPRRDVDGDGTVDDYIPSLEVCLALDRSDGLCANLPSFPSDVAPTEWWKLETSPFKGAVRVIHPKRTDQNNATDQDAFCTDHLGQVVAPPIVDEFGFRTCAEGQIFQRLGTTRNLWSAHAAWGPEAVRGDLAATMVNARDGETKAPGYGHEWVRFFDAPGLHAPN